MKSPNEQYVEVVARALHGKYGPANHFSWDSLKPEVQELWRDDARELLVEIRPDLRYVTARGQDHHELSEALGVEQGVLEWHRLIEMVRQLRGVRPSPVGEFSRLQATMDVVRAVLRLLSAEYAEPHAHSDDDSALAEDMLLDAARRLVAARAGDDPPMGSVSFGQLADRVFSVETVDPGVAYGHPAVYPLSVQSGRIVPKDEEL